MVYFIAYVFGNVNVIPLVIAQNSEEEDIDSLDFNAEEAIEQYDRILAISPNDPDILNNKGITLYNMTRYDEAIITFDLGLEVNPDHPGCLYNKGLVLDKLDRADEARQLQDMAQELDSTYGGGTIDKGPAESELQSELPSPI